jgi:hypothetical protein
MKYRKLRIAFSAFCCIACVLLIALWVRSCWRFDQFIQRISAADYVGYSSGKGRFVFGRTNDPLIQAAFPQKWTRRGFPFSEWDAALNGPMAFFPATVPGPDKIEIIRLPQFSTHPFLTKPGTVYTEVVMPYWLPIFSTVALAAIPWLRWRFSLRTLLIATTLIAVGLGVFAWRH